MDFIEFWRVQAREIMEKNGGKKLFLGIGVFDGVHLGHVKLVKMLAKMAEDNGGVPLVMTFDPHPKSILKSAPPPRLLVSPERRRKLLLEAGAAQVLIVEFNREFAALSAEDFLNILYKEIPGALGGICIGKNWRFGSNGGGNSQKVVEFCQASGLKYGIVEELEINGEVVSSSNIRSALASGVLEKATLMLGRHYHLEGVVEKGFHAATDMLQYPTANLKMHYGILPPDGVYAARAFLHGEVYFAAVNIGFAPSFNWQLPGRRLEVHLLNFAGNIYGEKIEVELLKYLRPERSFKSPDALKAQIALDINTIKGIKIG